MSWTLEEFEERIYNDRYVLVDPDYIQKRPLRNANSLIALVGDRIRSVKRLDYGGGSGLLSSILKESNWQSSSYILSWIEP
jgi:hypothetical protein